MYTDFHSHILTPNAIFCTAKPISSQPDIVASSTANIHNTPLLYCQGLLPQYWTTEEKEKLLLNLEDPKVHLGEVGLDKRFQNQIPLHQQEENLLTMLQYATKYEKIITIHSVQATERTINILKQAQLQPWKTIWHGFNGSVETAAILYKMKVFISIGPRYLGPQIGPRNKQNLKELAKAHPNFALETDYEPNAPSESHAPSEFHQPSELNQTYTSVLQTHYQNCATCLEWTVEDLKEHCYGQAQTLTH